MGELSLKSWIFHHCAPFSKVWYKHILLLIYMCYWYKLGYFKLKKVIKIIFVSWTLVLKFTVDYFSYWGEERYEHSSFFFSYNISSSQTHSLSLQTCPAIVTWNLNLLYYQERDLMNSAFSKTRIIIQRSCKNCT